MRRLILISRFKRSLRKYARKKKSLREDIEKTLKQMEIDIFAPNLSTHRLKGEFEGLRACSCGYDCRIIFSIDKDIETNQELLVLVNIGSHDDVY